MTSSIIYIPHGGGPLPLLSEPNHKALTLMLQALGETLPKPESIIVVSAHWEEEVVSVSSAAKPSMVYDYYGFSAESYQIQYPAPGNPQLAATIVNTMKQAGVSATVDANRGFDHGTFVPLKLMFPDADIPVVQVSLNSDLKPESQLIIGDCLADLSNENVLIIGSGLSFHNLQVMMNNDNESLAKSEQFDHWLNNVIVGEELSWNQKEAELINWQKAPEARFAHPREEHLLPIHVCFAAARKLGYSATNFFDQIFLNTKVSGFIWQPVG
ncbi:MAG: dioxygenase [Kangiellaceae bacterium]|nr:dioxygenase [Kangiellaceae bacterium]